MVRSTYRSAPVSKLLSAKHRFSSNWSRCRDVATTRLCGTSYDGERSSTIELSNGLQPAGLKAMIAKRVYYSGRVQGVGFRYTAQRVAEGYAVAGFVRNRPDGSVELVAQGEPDQVEAFLRAIRTRLAGYIER